MTTPAPPLVPDGPRAKSLHRIRQPRGDGLLAPSVRFDVSRNRALAAIDELAANFPAIRRLAAKRWRSNSKARSNHTRRKDEVSKTTSHAQTVPVANRGISRGSASVR